MAVGLLDLAIERAREAEQAVMVFVQLTGCTLREAWDHYEIVRDPAFFLPQNPDTRH